MEKKEKWIKRSVLGSMAALAVMAVVGCAEEITALTGGDDTKVEVTASFSDTGRESLTRAADGLDNSTAGFSLTTSESSSSKVRVMVDANDGSYSPFDYTITNATTITAPNPAPSFPSGVSTVNVYGWYPNVSLTNFSVNANQQSEANYCLSDLMVANSATCTRSGSSVTQSANLSFTHVMSKVKVSLTLASGVTVTAVKLKSILPQVTVTEQKTSNAVTSFNLGEASGSATDITLFSGSLTSASAAADKVLCGVFPPQSKNGAFLEITASYNSGAAQTITYSFGSAKAFARANEYTMNITLNGTNVTTGTVDISDWNVESGTVNITGGGGGGDAPTLSPTSLTLTYGGSSGTITPTLTGSSSFSAISTNTSIATVSGTSTITVAPVAAGTCKVNVFPTDVDGSFSSAVCDVTVNKAAQSVSLSGSTLSITALSSTNTFTVTRADNDGNITASSSNEGIATTSVNQSTGVVTVTSVAEGTATITVTVAEGTNHLAYTAADKTVTVTVTADPGTLLSSATSAAIGKVVGSDGKYYSNVASATNAGATVVGVLAYSGSTGYGYIIALQNSASATWSTVNGYTAYSGSIESASGSKLVPAGSYNGLSSYTTLGSTAVSNWVVLTKAQYTNMWNQFGGATNGTYNSTSNGHITAAGGTALSGNFYSCTPGSGNYVDGWYYNSSGWHSDGIGGSGVRPVLAF